MSSYTNSLLLAALGGVLAHLYISSLEGQSDGALDTLLIGFGGGVFGGLSLGLWTDDPTSFVSLISGAMGCLMYDKLLLL